MQYALLYTFSTIPQTLAAALGVLAAFVLYRLQSDSKTQWEDAREQLTGGTDGNAPTRLVQPPTTLNGLLGEQRFDELLAELGRIYEDQTPSRGSIKDLTYARLKASVKARNSILRALKVAFWWTAAVILTSVIVLCCTQVFWCYTVISSLVLAIGVASVARCLTLYYRLIRAALWGVGGAAR